MHAIILLILGCTPEPIIPRDVEDTGEQGDDAFLLCEHDVREYCTVLKETDGWYVMRYLTVFDANNRKWLYAQLSEREGLTEFSMLSEMVRRWGVGVPKNPDLHRKWRSVELRLHRVRRRGRGHHHHNLDLQLPLEPCGISSRRANRSKQRFD